jgi:PIN domain nuclease of toxin-antitoxin system
VILLDTHVLIWFVQADSSLGARTRKQIETAQQAEGIGISAITPWEVAMLVGKKRVSLGRPAGEWVSRVLALGGMRLIPLEPLIAVAAGELAGLHGDPADRILIATARHYETPLLTADRAILGYGVAGHVEAIDARR